MAGTHRRKQKRMGPKFLIDSNVIIDFVAGRLPEDGLDWLIETINEENQCFSPITQIEVLGYNGDPKDMARVERLLGGSTIWGIDSAVVAATIQLRKERKIKVPDAIIAATAMVHRLTLISRNTKDFKGIPGLEVINLHDR